jgi:hypothetical protein
LRHGLAVVHGSPFEVHTSSLGLGCLAIPPLIKTVVKA